MPEQLVAKADPISISKHPVIQAVLHPQPVDDLLPLRPRGHARRVILQRRIKSEPRSPSKLAKTKRWNQFANQTHVDAVLHDHVCAPIARRPGVGAAEPHHLRPVLHTERRTPSELYQPDRRVPQPNWGYESKMRGRGAGCHARTWDASSLLNPTSKKRTPSNRCSSPMSSSVPGEAMVGSETTGSRGVWNGIFRIWDWGLFLLELRARLIGVWEISRGH